MQSCVKLEKKERSRNEKRLSVFGSVQGGGGTKGRGAAACTSNKNQEDRVGEKSNVTVKDQTTNGVTKKTRGRGGTAGC